MLSFILIPVDNSHLLFHSSFLQGSDDGGNDARPSDLSLTGMVPTTWATTTASSAARAVAATTPAPALWDEYASFVRPRPSQAVSVFGGDGARRADALPAEEEDAVPAEDDGREKE